MIDIAPVVPNDITPLVPFAIVFAFWGFEQIKRRLKK